MIVFLGPQLGKHGVAASWVATAAIVGSFLCSAAALVTWLGRFRREFSAAAHVGRRTSPTFGGHAADDAAHKAAEHEAMLPRHGHAGHGLPIAAQVDYTGVWYKLGQFGKLKITISYFIDALTVAMFCDGDADRLVHSFLCHRLHARRIA